MDVKRRPGRFYAVQLIAASTGADSRPCTGSSAQLVRVESRLSQSPARVSGTYSATLRRCLFTATANMTVQSERTPLLQNASSSTADSSPESGVSEETPVLLEPSRRELVWILTALWSAGEHVSF